MGRFPFTGWLKENTAKLHLFELQQAENIVPRDAWEVVLAGSRVTDPEKVMHSMTRSSCFSELVGQGGIEFVVMQKENLV